MDAIKYGSIVKAGGRWGTLVSISKTHYGLKFSNGEVEYFTRDLVNLAPSI